MAKKLTKEERSKRASEVAIKRWEEKRKREAKEVTPEPQPVSEPVAPAPTPQIAIPEPPKRPKRPRMVKEFGVAHSYAEKRLAEAIKERAQAMAKVAMLNAEIPSLVQIIKALGNTPDLTGMQPDFGVQLPGTYIPPSMSQIDPAMLAPTAPLPNVPLAHGGGMGVIPETPAVDENMFLKGDEFTGGAGWR